LTSIVYPKAGNEIYHVTSLKLLRLNLSYF